VAVKSVNPPPVSTIQPMASSALDRLVQTCLAKSPDDRWQSAGDLSRELKWIAETGSKAGIPAPVAANRRNRERMAWLAAGLAAVPLLASLVWIVAHSQNEHPAAAMVRFQIPAPDQLNFYYHQIPAVSPDGERIAFTAAASIRDANRLFVRSLNAATATEIPVPGGDVHYPFWSPDGRQNRILVQPDPAESGCLRGTASHDSNRTGFRSPARGSTYIWTLEGR
jgi:hypothetical protein